MALGRRAADFADTKEFEAERGAPIIEDGLFKPGLAVKTRRDPIASLRHGAGDPGVTRFVGTDEADGAEIMEIADVECGQDQEDRGEAGHGRFRERIGCGVVGLRHGSKSLALSVYLGMVDVGDFGGKGGEKQVPRFARDDHV